MHRRTSLRNNQIIRKFVKNLSEDNVYQFLLFFDKLYDKFTNLEKKTYLKSFLSDVFIYEEEQRMAEY